MVRTMGILIGSAVTAILVATSVPAPAATVTETCKYVIRAKSQSAGIGSFQIPKGDLITKGRRNGNNDFSTKVRAMDAASADARKCLDAAAKSTRLPESCKPRGDVGVTKYDIKNIQKAGREALCSQAFQLEIENPEQIKDYSIYAMVKGGKKNACGGRLSKTPYHNIYKGTNLLCENGHTVREPVEKWTRWYSNKSPDDMSAYIRDFCKTRLSWGGVGQINKWEINSNNGKIRVHYKCQ